MDPIRYATFGREGTIYDDLCNLGRATTGTMTIEQTHRLRHYYALSCIRKIVLSIPEATYRYTRLLLAILLCNAAQCTHRKQWIRAAKYRVNREVISIAYHTFETTSFQAGWLHARSGLALQVTSNLAWRFFHRTNDIRNMADGWKSIESLAQGPVSALAFRMALWVRVRRIYQYSRLVFASGLLLMANGLGVEKLKKRLERIINEAVFVVQDTIDVPRYELGMAFPLLASHQADTFVNAARRTIQFAGNLLVNRMFRKRTP